MFGADALSCCCLTSRSFLRLPAEEILRLLPFDEKPISNASAAKPNKADIVARLDSRHCRLHTDSAGQTPDLGNVLFLRLGEGVAAVLKSYRFPGMSF